MIKDIPKALLDLRLVGVVDAVCTIVLGEADADEVTIRITGLVKGEQHWWTLAIQNWALSSPLVDLLAVQLKHMISKIEAEVTA